MERTVGVERVEELVETVRTDPMPVPVREVWVFGDLALGLDPVERLDVYLAKELLFGGDDDREAKFLDTHGVRGVGKTVSADWAARHPEYVRANENGYAAPERCLAAHLVRPDEPIHLEVCNASFEDNVVQRLRGARMREAYEEILDPRGVCLLLDGHRSETAFERLRNGAFPFPTLPDALQMLGLDEDESRTAADVLRARRDGLEGATVRGDVV